MIRSAFTIALILGVAAPANALFDEFEVRELNPEMWQTRTPLHGAKVMAGRPDSRALDGNVVQLVFPEAQSSRQWGPRWSTGMHCRGFNHYGTYSARMMSGKGLPGEGLISSFFTYANNEVDWDGDGLIDNHEIDIELSSVERGVIYVSAWTEYQYVGDDEDFHRIAARIDLRTGMIYATPEGGENGWDLEMREELPFTVPDFDHSKFFYTYGFEWQETSVVFWIDLEDGEGPRELWTIEGEPGEEIPSMPSESFANIWHQPVNWWTREVAPPPTRNAVLRIDRVDSP